MPAMLTQQDKIEIKEMITEGASEVIDALMPTLETLSGDINKLDKRLTGVETRLTTVETRLEQVDRKLDLVTDKVLDHDQRIKSLETSSTVN